MQNITGSNNAETSSLHWYALKVFFNKVFDIEILLTDYGIRSYIPCERQEKDGKRVPATNSLMFFRTTPETASRINTLLYNKAFVYSTDTAVGKKPYAIPDREMNIFMLVCSSGETGLEYFGADDSRLHKGDRVRVIDGIFKGAEGYIRRIKGNRRLIVSIQGVCAVATSYIPQCFLKKIDESNATHDKK